MSASPTLLKGKGRVGVKVAQQEGRNCMHICGRSVREMLGGFELFLFVASVWIIAGCMMCSSCLGAGIFSESPVFSLEASDKPLGKILKEITEATGYQVTIDEEWTDMRVSAKLKEVTIEEGLKKLLKGFNYALVTNESDRTIMIRVEDSSSISEPPKQGPEEVAKDTKPLGQGEIDPLDLEVIPPEHPGEPGITEREIEAQDSLDDEDDPLDWEVIPPERPGERGITERELKALEAEREEIDPKDLEVIPPDRPGERGITERELEAMEAAQEEIDPRDLEVIPPERPGERGITERELEALEHSE